MNSYETSTPRIAMALAAAAMAAMTIGAMVVLPAKLDSVGGEPYALAVARAATLGPIELAVSPVRSDTPDAADREEHVRVGRMTVGSRASRAASSTACLQDHTSGTACW
jgi:hypothetical protein